MTSKRKISRRSFLAASAAGAGALSLSGLPAHALESLRAGSVWQEARSLVDAGKIGRPYYVALRLSREPAPMDDIAVHLEKVAYALRLDAPDRVSAAGSKVEGDQFPADFMVTAKYTDGVTLSIVTGEADSDDASYDDAPYVIRGESGTLKVYDSSRPRVELIANPRSDSGGAVIVCDDDAEDWGQLLGSRLTLESALDSLRSRPKFA